MYLHYSPGSCWSYLQTIYIKQTNLTMAVMTVSKHVNDILQWKILMPLWKVINVQITHYDIALHSKYTRTREQQHAMLRSHHVPANSVGKQLFNVILCLFVPFIIRCISLTFRWCTRSHHSQLSIPWISCERNGKHSCNQVSYEIFTFTLSPLKFKLKKSGFCVTF